VSQAKLKIVALKLLHLLSLLMLQFSTL